MVKQTKDEILKIFFFKSLKIKRERNFNFLMNCIKDMKNWTPPNHAPLQLLKVFNQQILLKMAQIVNIF